MTSNGENERAAKVLHLHWGRRVRDVRNLTAAFLLAVAVIGGMAACTTWVMTATGWRMVGTAAELDVLEQKTDRNFAAVRAAEDSASARIDSLYRVVGDLSQALELMSYVQCVQLRRYDPDLLPPQCQQVIRDQQNGQRRRTP